jgi:hypothetical protein
MGGKSKSKSVDTSKQTQQVMDGLSRGGMSSDRVAGMQQDMANGQWGAMAPMFDALNQMGTQQMASNPMAALMGQLFGQEQTQQPQQAPTLTEAAPQQSAYEQRIAELMQKKGKTREEAIANQAYAAQMGIDYDNDGAVTNDEWVKYQQAQQPQGMPQGMPQGGHAPYAGGQWQPYEALGQQRMPRRGLIGGRQ